MRLRPILAAVAAVTLLGAPAARACDDMVVRCLPRVVVFPVVTPEGQRVGVVEVRVRPTPSLEVSRFTGQPLTVTYNNPSTIPHAVDPGFVLMPLPRVRRDKTEAVYPRGY